MKLSTRSRYGVRAMYELASKYGQGPITLKSIAEGQGISESYLEQLLASLRNAGLIKSSRGVQGGYQLTRSPQEVKVGDIIRILEGPIAPTECVSSENTECTNADKCVTRLIWKEVKHSLEDVLDNITLQDMCDKAETIGKIEKNNKCLN